MVVSHLSASDIRRLFDLLNGELKSQKVEGELYVVGGAVMCHRLLALGARDATQDVGAVFRPVNVVREAAVRVAVNVGADPDWLNDAVKGFLGSKGRFEEFLELSNLKIFVAEPSYLLAMKCVAMRLGAEFHDLEDVRFLLRRLNINDAEIAIGVVTRYFDEASLPPKTRLALQELLGDSN